MKQWRGRAVLLCSTPPRGRTRACCRVSLLPSSVHPALALAQPSQKRSMRSHSSSELPSSAGLCSRCGAGWPPAGSCPPGSCPPAPGGRRSRPSDSTHSLLCVQAAPRVFSFPLAPKQPDFNSIFTPMSSLLQEPDPCPAAAVPMEESEELLLAGQHDLPAELLEQGTAAHGTGQDDGFYIKIEFEKVCDGSVKISSLPGPPGRPQSEFQPPLKLWAGVDQEETRKQRQSEFLRRRRLFMALERERVREHQWQQKRQQRVAQIKRQKENQRRAEEQKMRDMAEHGEPSPGEGTWEALAQLQLEESRVRDRQQRNKERARYVEALRAQMKEKVKLCNIDLPPLCSCGSDFWDSHPDTCANNCIFYRNHKAYSQALHSAISSCAATRCLQDLAALCARSGKRL
ncbi:Coiled-coil domain-containing protein 15 [Lonchura striata]|uniref:Coiled-coil domain-containing protein 15 n=1 Tax=Lonchura striata TaxID=40157 RepID=A0A218UUP5_9PASE|nr:Coiled-coil domain-containing protein 15 [Lonchura striata domestica]